jgi:transaldolase
LFASISVKNPAYHDTRYVEELVTSGIVITMPQKTLDAVAHHAAIRGDTIRPLVGDAQCTLARIEDAGVSMPAITERLEAEGMHAFAASWENLITSTSGALRRAHSGLTP